MVPGPPDYPSTASQAASVNPLCVQPSSGLQWTSVCQPAEGHVHLAPQPGWAFLAAVSMGRGRSPGLQLWGSGGGGQWS